MIGANTTESLFKRPDLAEPRFGDGRVEASESLNLRSPEELPLSLGVESGRHLHFKDVRIALEAKHRLDKLI